MKPLHCLITAGPTREHLDPVRFFSNGSSGKMGYALAAAAVKRGWSVDLVSGPVALTEPVAVQVHQVISAEEMFRTSERLFTECDLFIAVAAVADYRPRQASLTKLKKTEAALVIELEATTDILKTLAARKTTGQIVVGFAAETHDVEAYAQRKLAEKNLDWIVANDISRPGIGINADSNAVVLFSREGARLTYGPALKSEVAEFILNSVAGPEMRAN